MRKKDRIRKMSTKRKNREEKERDYKYTAVMRALVWRYVSAMHRKLEENAVTEDDINEVKSDISTFRYEILEVLQRNGMDISCAEKKDKAVLGKKMKIWERRLMKDFKVAPVVLDEESELIYQPPPENEDSLSKFRRIAKLAVLNSNLSKWRQVVRGACIASQIGHCHNRDSFKKQQNLQRAMEAAKRLAVKSPDQSRATTPIQLPDTTGSSIIKVIREFAPESSLKLKSGISPSPSLTKTVKKPVISISPPETSAKIHKEEPDLINLESAKTSPIMPSKSFNKKTSLESLDKLIDDNLEQERSSDSNSLDDDKLLRESSPPAPASSDNKTEHVVESKNVKFNLNEDDNNKVDFKATESIFTKSEELDTCEIKPTIIITDDNQKEIPEETKEETAMEETPQELLEEKDSQDDVKEQQSEVADNDAIAELQASVELQQPQLDQEINNIQDGEVKMEENTSEAEIENNEVLDNLKDEKIASTSEAEIENSEALDNLKDEKVASRMPSPEVVQTEKSPLTIRNIRRVEDSTRRQPKTGWL